MARQVLAEGAANLITLPTDGKTGAEQSEARFG